MVRKSQTGRRIEICGGIASGKTSFARLFQRTRIKPIYEDFRANPFLKAFYARPDQYAFENEISFLLQHYHQIKAARIFNPSRPYICDFSLYLDKAYTAVTVRGPKAAFDSVFQHVIADLSPPDLLVYLDCDAETQMRRIRRRRRKIEEGITLKYLQSLNSAIRSLVSKRKVVQQVISVNSMTEDFVSDPKVKKRARSKVYAYMTQQ